MKNCKECRVELTKDNCYIAKGKYWFNECKKCCNARRAENHRKMVADWTWLYYLPEEHYIGITNNLRDRMNRHKRYGKLVEGMETIGKFARRVDAAYLEIRFHQRGYNGFNNEN